MGKSWPRTKEQQAFLDAKMDLYLLAQLQHAKAVFIAEVQNEWFKRWPERDALFGEHSVNLTAEQEQQVAEAKKKRKDQLKTYIRWHGDRYRNARRRLLRKRLASYLNTRKKKLRRKTLAEVYSSMYWDTKIAPVIEAAMEKTKPVEREPFKVYHSRRIKTMITVRDMLWKQEDPEIVKLVKAEKERRDAEQEGVEVEPKSTDDEKGEEGGEGGSDEQSLEELREDIENVIPVLRAVGKEIHDRTGFFITFLVGGMSVQGEIECHSMHCGTTVAGHTWPESMIGFKEKIGIPWTQFIHSTITPDMQRDRADFHLRQSTGASPSSQFTSMHDKALPLMGLYQMDDEEEEEELRKEMGADGGKGGSESQKDQPKTRTKAKKKKKAAEDLTITEVVGALQRLASNSGLDPKAGSASTVQPIAAQTSSTPSRPNEPGPTAKNDQQPANPPSSQGETGKNATGGSAEDPRGILQQLLAEVDGENDSIEDPLDVQLLRRSSDGGASEVPMPEEDENGRIAGGPERFLPPARNNEEEAMDDDQPEITPNANQSADSSANHRTGQQSSKKTGRQSSKKGKGKGRTGGTGNETSGESGKRGGRGKNAQTTQPRVEGPGNDSGEGNVVPEKCKRKVRAADDWEKKMELMQKRGEEERAKKRARV